MAKQGKQKVKECAYCGEKKERTRDHVIPQNLFVQQPPPLNLITVPACQSCHDIKNSGENETFLRDLLSTDIYGSRSAAAQHILQDTFARSTCESEVAQNAESHGKPKPMYDSEGVFICDAYSAPIDANRLQEMFSMIVRGLYYHERKEVLPANYIFRVLRYHPHEFETLEINMAKYMLQYPHGSRDFPGYYSYEFISPKPDEDLRTTYWLFRFFEDVCLTVLAVEPEIDKRTGEIPGNVLKRFGHKPHQNDV